MNYFEKFKINIQTACALLIFIHLSDGATVTDISRLRADLLRGYDPRSRPVLNHKYRMFIQLNFMLGGFDLNERTSILNVYARTYMMWWDDHLTWDPASYGNLTKVNFATHELWKPDFTVYNNVDKSEIDHFGNTQLTVFNNSLVWWVPPTKFQVSCQTNLRKWPYDTQKCTIVVGSWSHDGWELDIHMSPNVTSIDTTSIYEANREWDILGTTYERRVHYYTGNPVPFPDAMVTISIARKSAAHTACIVVAGLVIAAAVLVAFWLPPGSTQRLSILLISIVINLLYLKFIYLIIPNNGDSVPLVLLFYRDSLMMVAFALIWTIILRYVATTKRNSPVPLPSVIITFLNSVPAKILCLDPRPSTGSGGDGTSAGGDATGQGEGTGNGSPLGSGMEKKNANPFQEDWAWLAHLLDRVAFLIYLIIYLCFYIALL